MDARDRGRRRSASAHEFIERLPFGYDTKIGETGLAMSGGQRQRIAIARAIYHKPPILVFDEATSSLDTESERAVQQNIDALLRGRTSFVIAHRLSTVRNAELIIVLERGRLVEQGTHDELMRAPGALLLSCEPAAGGRLTMTGPESPAPFLDADPPPWAVRSLATILLLLFAVAVVALFVVHVPETVSATFTLRPMRGTDPVRTLHDGIVAKVNVEDAQTVAAGAVLFVIASEPVGDRMAERQTVDARLSGGRTRMENERQKYENQRRADSQEQGRLQQHVANLDAQLTLKQRQFTLTQDIATRHQKSFEEGIGTWMEASRQKLEADKLAVEVEQLRNDAADTRNALGA